MKNLNGENYPLQIFYQMIISLQMFLESEQIYWKLLSKEDPTFIDLFFTVDNLMNECTREGLGCIESSDVISIEKENKIWANGLLGDQHPHKLLDTLIYLLGIHCALRGGEEHRQLHRPGHNSQLRIGSDRDGKKCLVYKADPKSKTNQGSLTGRSCAPKMVNIYPNSDSAAVFASSRNMCLFFQLTARKPICIYILCPKSQKISGIQTDL